MDVHKETVATAAPRSRANHFPSGAGCKLSGLCCSVGRSQDGIELDAGNLGHWITEKVFEGGIAHLDRAVYVENHDAQRIVLGKRLQIGGVSRYSPGARRTRAS